MLLPGSYPCKRMLVISKMLLHFFRYSSVITSELFASQEHPQPYGPLVTLAHNSDITRIIDGYGGIT